MGYTIATDPDNQLVAIFRHGLSIAPLRAKPGDEPFRIQRLALLISGRRFTIRHVHGPSHGGADRHNFVNHLEMDEPSSLTIDAGDFNHVPPASCDYH